MKAIRIDSAYGTEPLRCSFIADSAVRPHRRPVFIPEGQWRCEIRPAIRFNRLGKAISAKFAPRYYNEWCLTNCLISENPSPLDAMIDDALTLGDLQPVEGAPLPLDKINELIEVLSRQATFKTGDIIILPDILESFEPRINQHISKDNKLEFTIK